MGLAACSGSAGASPSLSRTFTHEAMGTEFNLTLYSRPEDKGTDEIRGIADEAFTDGYETNTPPLPMTFATRGLVMWSESVQ
jgi:hypothetical protein